MVLPARVELAVEVSQIVGLAEVEMIESGIDPFLAADFVLVHPPARSVVHVEAVVDQDELIVDLDCLWAQSCHQTQ